MAAALRWGILGTGMIANTFARHLRGSRTGALAVTGSREAESAVEFAGKYGGRGVGGYEEVLADPAVEAIYISLPNGLHAEWTQKALAAGKHVLCEKPIALNEAEAVVMFEAAERAGKVLVEAFAYRLHPTVEKLVKIVRAGEIGELLMMRSNFTFERPVSLEDTRYQVNQGGGSMMDVGCYCVHLFRTLTQSEPTAAHATAFLHESGVDQYAAGVLNFGKALGTFTCGMTMKSDTGTYLAGTKGMIEIPAFWMADAGFLLKRGEEITHYAGRCQVPHYALEADAFAAVVSGEREPWITKADSIGNMRVLDTLRKSSGVPLAVLES